MRNASPLFRFCGTIANRHHATRRLPPPLRSALSASRFDSSPPPRACPVCPPTPRPYAGHRNSRLPNGRQQMRCPAPGRSPWSPKRSAPPHYYAQPRGTAPAHAPALILAAVLRARRDFAQPAGRLRANIGSKSGYLWGAWFASRPAAHRQQRAAFGGSLRSRCWRSGGIGAARPSGGCPLQWLLPSRRPRRSGARRPPPCRLRRAQSSGGRRLRALPAPTGPGPLGARPKSFLACARGAPAGAARGGAGPGPPPRAARSVGGAARGTAVAPAPAAPSQSPPPSLARVARSSGALARARLPLLPRAAPRRSQRQQAPPARFCLPACGLHAAAASRVSPVLLFLRSRRCAALSPGRFAPSTDKGLQVK